jgi:hypothetical protein
LFNGFSIRKEIDSPHWSRGATVHQVQIHGPVFVGDDIFVGMKSLEKITIILGESFQ